MCWASFDDRREYRFTLGRSWEPGLPRCAFIMLNPSTADENVLDPTVRRCLRYAQAWGFGSLEVGNLFALRSTDPKVLSSHADPVGPANDQALLGIRGRAATVVAAWGNGGLLRNRGREVARMLGSRGELWCLGLTKLGEPRHPLYISRSTPLQPWIVSEVRLI